MGQFGLLAGAVGGGVEEILGLAGVVPGRLDVVNHRVGVPTRCSAIHFLAVADFHDENDQFLVLNGVEDPVVSFANAIEVVFTCELLHAGGSRIIL